MTARSKLVELADRIEVLEGGGAAPAPDLEPRVAALEAQVTTLEAQAADHEARIAALELPAGTRAKK
jgi:BMFP domain-containing protein YqiC